MRVNVLAIAGRRIDASDAGPIRFPIHLVEKVRLQIRQFLVANKVAVTVSAAACGVDLIALEECAEIGIESHIVLPSSVEVFRTNSVIDRPGNWGATFDKLTLVAKKKSLLSIYNLSEQNDASYLQGNVFILNKANEVARHLKCQPKALIVWDGVEREGLDVTANFARVARQLSFDVHELVIR